MGFNVGTKKFMTTEEIAADDKWQGSFIERHGDNKKGYAAQRRAMIRKYGYPDRYVCATEVAKGVREVLFGTYEAR